MDRSGGDGGGGAGGAERSLCFRPCIDLRNGKVTQIVGATLRDAAASAASSAAEDAQTNFLSDQGAAHFARMYAEDGLRGGHVIMRGPGKEEAALEALRAYPGGLQVGGGVGPHNAATYIEAGASHVIVTSYAFDGPRLSEERLRAVRDAAGGRKRLVLDLSCRQRPDDRGPGRPYYVVTDRWQTFTDLVVDEATMKRLAEHCDEFLVHGVDVEGLRQGVQEDLVEALGRWSPIPVTYAGGVRSMDDIELVRRLGRGRVDLTVGSALDIFGGDLPYKDVVRSCGRFEG